MPKKIRTLDDDVKSLLTKKKKTNPMQKIAGMPKEHIIKSHDELLKEIKKDLEDFGIKKISLSSTPKEVLLVDDTHINVFSPSDSLRVDKQFMKAPPGMIVVGGDSLDPPKIDFDSEEWEKKVEFMRADLACGMGYSRIIETVRVRMKEDGLDFDEEFKKWKGEKDANAKKYRV